MNTDVLDSDIFNSSKALSSLDLKLINCNHTYGDGEAKLK